MPFWIMDSVRDKPDEEAFLPKANKYEDAERPDIGLQKNARWKSFLRTGIEVVMGVVIIFLFLRPLPDNTTSKPSPVPKLPKKTYTFLENKRYLHEDMFVSEVETGHTLHNWIELSSSGRGYVSIKDAESFDLDEPWSLNLNATHTTPVYMMSVFHQLHCLSYLVEHFQTGFAGTELTPEVAKHSAHCFDYIRQSIMCSADTSLEGNTEAGPGWGSKHECTDYDALLNWVNENTLVRWRGNGPDTSGL